LLTHIIGAKSAGSGVKLAFGPATTPFASANLLTPL
jgi:hypothetical protein